MSLADKISKGKPSPKLQPKEPDVIKAAEKLMYPEDKPKPKPRGRPKSKSPGRATPKESPEDVATSIRKRKLMSRLRALHKLFPDELQDLANLQPHNLSLEQLQEVIASCEFALEDDIQIQYLPNMMLKSIQKVDSGAMMLAKTNPRLPFAKYAHFLQGFGQRAAQDPDVIRDIKLIATRMIGIVPTNPYFRVIGSLFMIGYQCIIDNKVRFTQLNDKVESDFEAL